MQLLENTTILTSNGAYYQTPRNIFTIETLHTVTTIYTSMSALNIYFSTHSVYIICQ